MRITTVIALLITVLLTVVIMQNNQPVSWTFLFMDFYVPKLVMLTAVSVSAFLLGLLVGLPSRRRYNNKTNVSADDKQHNTDTLSEEDRNYIN